MSSITRSVPGTTPVSLTSLRVGRALGALAVVFLLLDSLIKVMMLAPAVEGTTLLGYPESAVFTIGVIELACLIVYLVPRTSVLGAILLTGYLGGAVATHVRIESPLLTHTLFPIYIGLIVWAALVVRDDSLRALIPVRRTQDGTANFEF